MWRVRFSRRLNLLLGGKPNQMLSSRAHAEGLRCEIIINALFFDRNHCRNTYRWEQRRGKMNHEPNQPNLPLDERFRQAEQYAFDFNETPPPRPEQPTHSASVCIGYCDICPQCDNGNNRN